MNGMAFAYLVAGILGIVTALMVCKVQEQLKVADSELLLLAAANMGMGGILLCIGGIDYISQVRSGEGILIGFSMPLMYMVVAVVEWIFCGLAVLYLRVLKQDDTREE